MMSATNEKTQEKRESRPPCSGGQRHEYELYRSFPSRWFLKARQYRCRLCGHLLTTHEVTTQSLNALLEAAGDPRRVVTGAIAAKASREYRYDTDAAAMVARAAPPPGDPPHEAGILVRPRRRMRNSRNDTMGLSKRGPQREPQGDTPR